MKFEFPDTGEGVTEGQFLQWLVEEGEEVEEDQAVAEVETDKAVVDIPAPADGKIKNLRAEPGDTIKVGEVILEIDLDDEEATEPEEASEEDSEQETELKTEKEIDHSKSKTSSSSSGDVLALPKVRHLAAEKGVDLASIKTGERITEEEVLQASEGGKPVGNTEKENQEIAETENVTENKESSEFSTDYGDVLATPAVRKLAREKNVEIQKIDGSGRGGKVTRDDVLSAAEEGVESTKESREQPSETGQEKTVETGEQVERVKMSNIRKTTAERMAESKFTAPHVTHMEKADVTELVEIREEHKEKMDVHLTYLPFIMKAVVEGLKKHPNLNAELDEENNEIVRYRSYDFNMAVDTEKGLMVPKINDIDQKSIISLAEEIVDKAGKAKEGELNREEMKNGTFSITNIGVIGGEEFTPIINYPQTGILGIGKIQETAEVIDGEVVPRKTVKLSLSYDHRVVDGAEAARFMNEVVENLEDPEKLMMSIGL